MPIAGKGSCVYERAHAAAPRRRSGRRPFAARSISARQRVTAVALVPLAIWFRVSALSLIGADRDDAVAFLAEPLNAVLMALFIVAALMHMALGLQVVIEDYVHSEGGKVVLLAAQQILRLARGRRCDLRAPQDRALAHAVVSIRTVP